MNCNLSFSPNGIWVDGIPLSPLHLKMMYAEAARHVMKAHQIVQYMTGYDWNRTDGRFAEVQKHLSLAMQLAKAGFNPAQPRVPAGSEGGGQWTSVQANAPELSDVNELQQMLEEGVKTPYGTINPLYVNIGSSGKGKGIVNIFIGGGGDSWHNNIVQNSTSLKRLTGNNYYFTHDQQNEINNFLQYLPNNMKINIIGHSWGGDTAARVVLDNVGRINHLTTVDPVTTIYRKPDFGLIHNAVSHWLNINAIPSENRYSSGDIVASLLNGKWGYEPNGYATNFVTANAHHEDFDNMLSIDINGSSVIEQLSTP